MKSDKCAPMVKFVELDGSDEHLPLSLCCLARLAGPSLPHVYAPRLLITTQTTLKSLYMAIKLSGERLPKDTMVTLYSLIIHHCIYIRRDVILRIIHQQQAGALQL